MNSKAKAPPTSGKNKSAGRAGRDSPPGYETIVNAIPDLIIRVDRQGVFQSFEGNTEELYWPQAVYLGKSLAEVLPAETAALFMQSIEAAFRSGQVELLEYSLRIDGQLRYYESRMIRSSNLEVLAIVRNVTPRKQAEAALHRTHTHLESLVAERTAELLRAETSYRSIFHHSGSPSIIVDLDFTIAKANPKFEELTGFSRDEIEGRMRWIDFIAAVDRPRVEAYHFARRSPQSDAPVEYECQIIDRQGQPRDIFIKVGMLPEPGRSIASLIDITPLKQTEKELRERETLYSAILKG